MKKVLFSIILISSFILVGCGLKDKAEEEAQTFAESLNLDVEAITCVNQDSDGDGYVSCTFKMKTGEMMQYECAASIMPSFKDGCREPKVKIPFTGR